MSVSSNGLIAVLTVILLGEVALAQNDAEPVADAPPQLYRWIDAQGRAHFADAPPDGRPSEAVQQDMPQLPATGVRLADDLTETEQANKPQATTAPKKRPDSRCRRYHSDLNKTELYLRHTPNARDQQRAADLKQQIALECSGHALKRDLGDARCRGYHSKLNKLRIYYRHSPTDRDKRKIDDLERQIEMEC